MRRPDLRPEQGREQALGGPVGAEPLRRHRRPARGRSPMRAPSWPSTPTRLKPPSRSRRRSEPVLTAPGPRPPARAARSSRSNRFRQEDPLAALTSSTPPGRSTRRSSAAAPRPPQVLELVERPDQQGGVERLVPNASAVACPGATSTGWQPRPASQARMAKRLPRPTFRQREPAGTKVSRRPVNAGESSPARGRARPLGRTATSPHPNSSYVSIVMKRSPHIGREAL